LFDAKGHRRGNQNFKHVTNARQKFMTYVTVINHLAVVS